MTLGKNIRRFQRSILNWIVKHHPGLGLEERAEFFVRIFENYLPKKSFILDVGGGWGFYDRPLRARGHAVTVLDVARSGLQKAPLVVYDGKKIPFPDKSFDVSMFITVLHHISDWESVLLEALRVTRKKVIVVEDLYRHRWGRIWTILRDMFYNCEFWGHPKNFKTREEWLRLLQDRFGMVPETVQEVQTRLLGLGIRNGVFVFGLKPAAS